MISLGHVDLANSYLIGNLGASGAGQGRLVMSQWFRPSALASRKAGGVSGVPVAPQQGERCSLRDSLACLLGQLLKFCGRNLRAVSQLVSL